MQHKLSFAFSVEHQGISSAIVLYVNPTSLMENAKERRRKGCVAKWSRLSL
jgi:hypothetical protein